MDSPADRTIQPGEKDAFEPFSPADSPEIRPRVFTIKRAAEGAVAVDQSAMMAQQIKSETDAGQTRAPRNSAIQEQVIKASTAIAAGPGSFLSASTELTLAYQRHESTAV